MRRVVSLKLLLCVDSVSPPSLLPQEPGLAVQLLGAIQSLPTLISQASAASASPTDPGALPPFLSQARLAGVALAVFGGEFVSLSVGARVTVGGKEDGTLLGVDPEAGLAVVATDADPATPTRVPLAGVTALPRPVPKEVVATVVAAFPALLPAVVGALTVGTGPSAALAPSRLPNTYQAVIADLQVLCVCVRVFVCVCVCVFVCVPSLFCCSVAPSQWVCAPCVCVIPQGRTLLFVSGLLRACASDAGHLAALAEALTPLAPLFAHAANGLALAKHYAQPDLVTDLQCPQPESLVELANLLGALCSDVAAGPAAPWAAARVADGLVVITDPSHAKGSTKVVHALPRQCGFVTGDVVIPRSASLEDQSGTGVVTGVAASFSVPEAKLPFLVDVPVEVRVVLLPRIAHFRCLFVCVFNRCVCVIAGHVWGFHTGHPGVPTPPRAPQREGRGRQPRDVSVLRCRRQW